MNTNNSTNWNEDNDKMINELLDNKAKLINYVIGNTQKNDRDSIEDLISEQLIYLHNNVDRLNSIYNGTILNEDGSIKYTNRGGGQALFNYIASGVCNSLRSVNGTYHKLQGKYNSKNVALETKHEGIANSEEGISTHEKLEMIDLILNAKVDEYRAEIFRAYTKSIENDKGLLRTISLDELCTMYPNEKRWKLHSIVEEVKEVLKTDLYEKSDDELEPLRVLAQESIQEAISDDYTEPYKPVFKLLC